jgi:predicted TIM-barrel fold metal-dependent hydrolase
MAFCGEDGSDVRTFLEEMDLDDELREDITHLNAEKLFVI